MSQRIKKCRISNSNDLIKVISLGEQYLTGVFPKSRDEAISKGPLNLLWCKKSNLLQLSHSYPLDEMYGDNYGYRSGLNGSMVNHLTNKARFLESFCDLKAYDLVVDIGSNDATLLKSYKSKNLIRVGIDPTGEKFQKFYTGGIDLIPEFFPSVSFLKKYYNKKVKLITSIAMFYDLESPGSFVKSIYEILADDGVWHFEQSYMPAMLRTNSYDTICHEHLEYYSLGVVNDLLNQFSLQIIDVQFNDINGGSFAVTASKTSSSFKPNQSVIDWLLYQEEKMQLNTPLPYKIFEKKVYQHREDITNLINRLNNDGKTIIGYGASTKGNVLLQFCDLSENEIPFIAEVNEDKYGCFTPGSKIPIIPEKDAREMEPDYFLILPWHFKNGILAKEREFISRGGKFIVPLPEIQII
jgi:hypothetical protein